MSDFGYHDYKSESSNKQKIVLSLWVVTIWFISIAGCIENNLAHCNTQGDQTLCTKAK